MIKRDSEVPIYLQVKRAILEHIDLGTLKTGDKLPSERALGQRFQITRMTVRQALKELSDEGVIEVVSGKGAFVTEHKLTGTLEVLRGFTEEIQALGMTPSSEVLERAIVHDPSIALLFDRARNHEFLKVDRVRYGNGNPLALERAYFDLGVCRGLESVNLSGSVYKTLREHSNILPVRARQNIEAYLPNSEEQELFHMRELVPCLLIKRRTYSQTSMMFEYVEAVFRGDQYKFSTNLGDWS